MFGVSGNILSAAELTNYRFRTEQELPEKGQREYQPSSSWIEKEQLKTALDERSQLIAEERVSWLGTLARAEWNEEIKEALVTGVVGRHWQLFGHERKTRIWLYPEEALFLLECGCLELMFNGVAMSVQQAYCILLTPNTSRTLDEYRTYAHLLRHGYRVLRHKPSAKYVQPGIEAVHPDSNSVRSNSYIPRKKEPVRTVLEVVDISDSKPKPSRLSHRNTEASFSSDTSSKNELSTPEKCVAFNQRTEPLREVSTNHKFFPKLPTEEADVTLVCEQKGPVIQSCLKPKGSLVLFPDSRIESLSSSRTLHVTPIDIDDNELEISYVNRNVSVTLSPQKKERQEAPTPPDSIIVKDLVVKDLSDLNKECSGSRLEIEYEEQSVTLDESPSFEEGLQCEKLQVVQKFLNVDKADKLQTVSKVVSSYHGSSDDQVEGTADNDNVNKEVLNYSTVPVELSTDITFESHKRLTSGSGKSGIPAPEEKILNCGSITVIPQSEVVATDTHDASHKNHDTLQETASVSECELITERKTSETRSVQSGSKNKNDSSLGVDIVEKNGNIFKPAVKSETEDIIEIQENSNDNYVNRTSSSSKIYDIELSTNSNKVKDVWQQRTTKKEDDDIEIICDTTPNFSRIGERKVSGVDPCQSIVANNFTDKSQTIAETVWKQFPSTVSVKPDVEILLSEDSNSTSAEFKNVSHVTESRKRGHEDQDIKEECSNAKKPLLNTNNWSQDDDEAVETKPSTSQQINIINLEDDDGRLTLAERKAVLDAIPSIEKKFTIHVQAPQQDLLPPSVKPKQKDYYIQLWRLKADGFGGGPVRNSLNYTNRFPVSQPVRHDARSENDGRINPWLPSAMLRPQMPLMGYGNGLLPHPMFAQAIMMAQSLAMAQSMAMNFNYGMPQHYARGRFHRPYYRRGYRRRYNNNYNRGQPYYRNQSQSRNSHQFSRNSGNDDSSDSQSRAQSVVVPAHDSKISASKNMQIVIDIDDDEPDYKPDNKPDDKLHRKVGSDDDVIECYEVVPAVRGSTRRKHGRARGSDNRYFAPSKKFQRSVAKMWHEERGDAEEVSVVGTRNTLASHFVKREQKNIEVTLSSDEEEQLDDSMSEQVLSDVDEFSADVVPCLQPENCQSVDTILSRLQIFQQGKKPRNLGVAASRQQLRITFDMYLPNMSFRKTTPGLPDYRIIIFSQDQFVSHYEQSVPTLGDISWALKDFDDNVPLLLARVDPDSIQFTLFARIDLPLAPGIVCNVL